MPPFGSLLLLQAPGAPRKRRLGRLVLAVLLGGLAAPSPVLAAGDLLIAPTRVVLDEGMRSTQVWLVNKDTKPATYRITLERRRMLEDGRFETVEEALPDELFANDMLRYAPRRVTLEPNVPQTIRVLLRKPRDLVPGEYRSHLLFRAVPDTSAGQSAEALTESADGFSIQLVPVYGVSIPIIVRHGDLEATVAVTGTTMSRAGMEDQPSLDIQLARTGARSVYGDLKIRLAEPERPLIGQIRGVAVYYPNRRRSVRVPIDPTVARRLEGREVEVEFSTPTDAGARTLAAGRFTLR